MTSKDAVRDFWNEAACGEGLLLPSLDAPGFAAQSAERYRLEPYIIPFADFENAKGLEVLEIGLGLGADHERFALGGARLHGIDITTRAVEITSQRLGSAVGFACGRCRRVPFESESFDFVYSWGVIHHSPDTALAAREIMRVLKPGGRFRVMIYHT
jgi:ubiquinone/menaquinone biosynthesis C-methylase UbiE